MDEEFQKRLIPKKRSFFKRSEADIILDANMADLMSTKMTENTPSVATPAEGVAARPKVGDKVKLMTGKNDMYNGATARITDVSEKKERKSKNLQKVANTQHSSSPIYEYNVVITKSSKPQLKGVPVYGLSGKHFISVCVFCKTNNETSHTRRYFSFSVLIYFDFDVVGEAQSVIQANEGSLRVCEVSLALCRLRSLQSSSAHK